MIVKKSELNFLSKFVDVSDHRAPLNDKINIEVQGSVAHFSLSTDSVVVTTSLELDNAGENFSVFLPVKPLNSLIRTLNDDVNVEINQNTVKFYGGSYTFESADSVMSLSKQIAQYDSSVAGEIYFRDIEKLKIVEPFCGTDNPSAGVFWDSVVYTSGKYVSSNGIAMSVVHTQTDYEDRIHLPRTIARLFSGLGVDSLRVSVYDNKWMSFNVDNIRYFIQQKRSSIPDAGIWYDGERSLRIPVNVKIDKSILKPVLARMSLVVSDKAHRAMSISFANGKAIFGSLKYNPSYEEVVAEYSHDVEGVRVVVSYDSFYNMYNLIDRDFISIGVKTDDSIKRNIYITDENMFEGFISLIVEQ